MSLCKGAKLVSADVTLVELAAMLRPVLQPPKRRARKAVKRPKRRRSKRG